MARYVLDTHACVFALAAPKKLGTRAKRVLSRAQAGRDEVRIPAAVAAEVILLKELGRTDIGLPELQAAFAAPSSWRFLPLDIDQLDEFSALAAIRDPFDRLIVAAARATSSRLVSRDGNLTDLGLVDTVWT